jgi:hypothetical protein
MIIRREWAMPNKWTFTIKPIKKLLNKYAGNGFRWIDPYAGKYSPAEITNDINKRLPAKFHMDAKDFCKKLTGEFKGVLFDPPYSNRQVTEHYAKAGIKATQLDTSSNFYNRTMNSIYKKIENGGYAISFGWNSNGFGKKRGFEIIEILLVAHGGRHNDTICIVEKKVQSKLTLLTGVKDGK